MEAPGSKDRLPNHPRYARVCTFYCVMLPDCPAHAHTQSRLVPATKKARALHPDAACVNATCCNKILMIPFIFIVTERGGSSINCRTSRGSWGVTEPLAVQFVGRALRTSVKLYRRHVMLVPRSPEPAALARRSWPTLVPLHSAPNYVLISCLQIKSLNRGTFGVVQLYQDKVTGEQVAIKFIERGDRVRQLHFHCLASATPCNVPQNTRWHMILTAICRHVSTGLPQRPLRVSVLHAALKQRAMAPDMLAACPLPYPLD